MKNIFRLLIAGFIFRVILSFISWHPDLNNHVDWGIRFWQYGPAKFYSANVWSFTWPNQPPGTIYIFAGIRKVYEATFGIFSFLHFNLHVFPGRTLLFLESNLYPALLKLPGILADLGIAYLIYRIFAKEKKERLGIFGAVLFLFNPVIWYNSSVWGQTDSIINFFALLSFFLLFEKKVFWAILALTTSFYIKASLFIFLPIFLIVLVRQKYKLEQIVISLIVSALVVWILSFPFSKGEVFGWLFGIYKDKVFSQQLQVVSANALNFWGAIFGVRDSAVEVSHDVLFGPLNYKIWGYILFSIFYAPALWLVYKKQDIKSVVWSLVVASFSSFMLLTNMHERYLYPLFPYLTILAAVGSVDLLIYWLISFISLVNLYNFWWVPKIDIVVNVLSAGDRLAPRLLGFVNLGLFVYLYIRFLRLLGKAKI